MKKSTLLLVIIFFNFLAAFSQPGIPDQSFGTNGVVKTSIGSAFNYTVEGRRVLVQSDGTIYSFFYQEGQTVIAKKYTNGSADINYGTNGFTMPVPFRIADAVFQTDGKIVMTGYARNAESDLNVYDFAVARFNVDGSLDNTFGNGGIAINDLGSGERPQALAVQPDGKIVVAGAAGDYDVPFAYVIARYNSNGTLDETFNSNGVVYTDLEGDGDVTNSVVIQSDGKIVLGGNLAIARYNQDGSLDAGFNETGILYVGYYIKQIAVQADNKILAAGYDAFTISRFKANGKPDSTFGTYGVRSTNFGGNYESASLIFIEANSKIIVQGITRNSYGENNKIAIAHYNSDGSLDPGYSGDGKQVIVGNPATQLAFVAKQADGKLVALSNTQNSITLQLARYTADGTPDNTFDGDGILVYKLSQGFTGYKSLATQADGKTVAAGYAWNGSNYDFTVARYNTNGSLDGTFSGDGILMTDFASADDRAKQVAIQPDGKILVAGSTGDKLVIVRYNPDGSLDNTFAGDGSVNTNVQYHNDDISTLIIQADGHILIGVSLLLRFTPGGSPDLTFNGSGQAPIHVYAHYYGVVLAVQSDEKIIVAGEYGVERLNKNGSPDFSFGSNGNGIVDYFPGYLTPNFRAVAVQSDGKIILGGTNEEIDKGINFKQFAITRLNPDGSPDALFGENGSSFVSASRLDYATSLAIQADDKVILAGYGYNGSDNDFAIARFNTDGSLDNTFSNNGILITPVSPSNDQIEDIAILNNKLYVVGEAQYPGHLGIVARYLLDNTNNNKAPDITLTAPSNNAIFTAPASFALKANATDPGGSITSVQFFNGSTLLKTDSTIPYDYTVSNLAPGNYSFVAKATSNNGISNNSATVSITVLPATNKGPVVTITNPVSNSTYIAPGNFTINATASDADGTIANVKFFNGSKLLGTDSTKPYSFTVNNATTGIYKFYAQATDNTGLKNSSSTVFAFVVPASANKAPVVNFTSPVNNANYPAVATIVLHATASDADGSVTSVQFYNGSVLIATDNTSPYSCTIPRPATGRYTFVAKAIDNNGLSGNSATVTVGVGGLANKTPAVHLTLPANNANYVAPGNITLNATASDADGNITGVQFYSGAVLLKTDSIAPYTYTINNAVAGNYKFYAKAIDNAGLTNSSATVSAFVVPAASQKAPVIRLINPKNNEVHYAPGAIYINTDASDEDGAIMSVKYYMGSTLLYIDSISPYNFNVANVPVGNYTIVAKATDDDGLESNTATAIVPVLAPPNKAPVVNITSPANNAMYAAPATLTLSAAATDPDGTITTVQFYKGSTLLGTDNTSPYSFTINDIKAGTYKFYVKAIDNKGASNASATVYVVVTVPSNPFCSSNDQPTFSYNFNGKVVGNINNGLVDSIETARITVCNGGQYPESGHIHSSPSNLYDLNIMSKMGGTLLVNGYVISSAVITAAEWDSFEGVETLTLADPYVAGTLVQKVTPFRDLNYNGILDAGDCAGEPLWETYTVNTCLNKPVSVVPLHARDVTGVDNGSLSLRLSPNPVHGILNIYPRGLPANNKAVISVISLSGVVLKTIQSGSAAKTIQMNVSSLTSGMYILKVTAGEKILYKQFMKM